MSVRSVRDILVNLLGKETISQAAGKAERGLGKLGDQMDDTADSARGLGDETDKTERGLGGLSDRLRATADDAKRLDAEISKAEGGLKDLALQYARTGDAASRIDLTKAMRAQQAELRRLTRARGLLEPLVDDADQAGQQAGRGFWQKFREQLGPGEMKRAGFGAGGLLATGLVAGLLAGAGGLVLGGAVAGSVAGGVAVAARDSRVQAAGKELGNAVLADLEATVGARFVEPTLDGMRTLQRGWRDVRGEIDGAAKEAAQFVEPLSRGLVGFVREFAPGLREGLAQAGPVVAELERGLTGLGRTLGDFFRKMGDNSESLAAGLRFVFGVVEVGVEVVGDLIVVFGNLYKTLLDVRLAAAEAGAELLGWAPLFGDDLRETADRLREQREELKRGAEAGEDAGERTAFGFQRAGEAADESARKVRSWADVMRESLDRVVAHEMAGIRAAEAMDRLGEAAREGAGKGIDQSTEAGRRNRTALIEAAQAAIENAESIRTTTGDHLSAAEATRQARRDFLRAADAMGAEKTQAVALANSLFGIPNVKRDVDVDTKRARAQVNAYKEWLRSVNLDKTSTIRQRIIAEQGTARGGNREFSLGGYVDAPGPKGVDSVDARLAPGEGVLTAREVDRLGGPAGFERLRQVIRSGGRPSSAAAPAMTGGGPAAMSAAELTAAFRSALAGLMVVMDGRAVGAIQGRQADIYGRGV